MTSLHIAATYYDEELTRCLLETGHDPNVVETELNTPLCGAVMNGSYSIAKLLLDHNARIDLANNTGLTALHAAALSDSLDLLKLLLSRGGDSNCQSASGSTPLLYAVMNQSLEATRLLLKYDAEPNKHSKDGLSPLFVSVRDKNMSIMSLLLEKGADPNAITRIKAVDSANLFTSTSGDVERSGTESPIHNKTTSVGNECHEFDVNHTPISLAVSTDFEDGLSLLLSVCGNIVLVDPEHTDNNILHYAIPLKNDRILGKLIDKGAERLRYSTNNNGETPLHIAAQVGNLMATSMLVHAGCDINQRDNFGSTPLVDALFYKHYGIASLLLERGADEAIADEFEYDQVDGKFIVHRGPRDASLPDSGVRLSALLPQSKAIKESI